MAAGKDTVSGSKVSGATNIEGSGPGMNPALAGLGDDIATRNANTAASIPKGRGTTTSKGRIYGVGAGGQTDGGY